VRDGVRGGRVPWMVSKGAEEGPRRPGGAICACKSDWSVRTVPTRLARNSLALWEGEWAVEGSEHDPFTGVGRAWGKRGANVGRPSIARSRRVQTN
jgi:hypothetical protein